MSNTHGVSRRTLLSAALAMTAAGPLLAGCGSGPGGGGAGPRGAAVPLPTLNEGTVLPPDLPATPQGIQPAYFSYPADPRVSVPAPPGSGEPMRAMVLTYATPGASSQYVDAVNKALNVPLDLILVPEPEYPQRFATTIAGGDLPHVMMVPLFAQLPRIGAFLESKAVDLSDQLTGDAVNAYPNLAAVPAQAWRNARINGRIWGVPIPRNVFNRAAFYRKDLLAARGVEIGSTAEEFKAFCGEVTNRGKGEYAVGGFASGSISPLVLILFSGMFNVPNQWRDDAGALTYYIETEEFKQSVDYARGLWQAGFIHPDTPSMKSAQAGDLLTSGKIYVLENGNTGWAGTQRSGEAATPGFLIDAIPPFGADGGPGTHWEKQGAFSYSIITETGKERVPEMLKIMDYCAAPFGTAEYTLLNFGLPGVHHEPGKNGPSLTDLGKDEIFTSYNYLGAPAQVLYNADLIEQVIKPAHAWETKAAPVLLADPTVGLYSETASRSLSGMLTKINDTITSVVVGREQVSALDALAESWRRDGGDKMRGEFQDALQQQG